MGKRQCKVLVCCGLKGCGKTVATIKMFDKAVMGNPAKGVPPRKCLILDTNNEFGDFWFYDNPHRRIKTIALEDLERYSLSPFCEIRRIAPFLPNGEPMGLDDLVNATKMILNSFTGGYLLLEDPTVFLSENMPNDIMGKLATCRHRAIDLVLHHQGVGKVFTPKLFSNTAYVRLHKTNDSVMRHEMKILDKAHLFAIAENIVNHKYFEEGEERFYVMIDNDKSKIHAGEIPFTEADVDRAIHEYMSMNRNTLVKPYTQKIDLVTGQKVYPDERAILQIILKKLKQTYFD